MNTVNTPHGQEYPLAEPSVPATDGRQPVRRIHQFLVYSILLTVLLSLFCTDVVDAKRKKRRHVEPPLRIVSITLSPEHYIAGNGSLDFEVQVKLPPEVDGSTVLEVSSLITSPSQKYLRFLWSRKPIALHFDNSAAQTPDIGEPPDADAEPTTKREESSSHVSVILSWDGKDQNRELVPGGRFDYVIRAKLLAVDGDKLSTQMLSWKKKGRVEIKSPEINATQKLESEGDESNDESGDSAP